jgi:cyclophilin family peptidyl-prolyl cis-trans isomerase
VFSGSKASFRAWLSVIAIAVALVATVAAFTWRERAGKSSPEPKASQSPDEPRSTLLEQMNSGATQPDEDLSGEPATDGQLAKSFATITQNQQQLDELRIKASTANGANNADSAKRAVTQAEPLVSLLNSRLAAFQRDLTRARQARPQDPVLQWFTGELLEAVGGEPATVVPYLSRAVGSGLKNPQLYASLARVEFELNRFQASHDDALNVLRQDRESHEGWEIYSRASFALEYFSEVLQWLDQTFPGERPRWAETIRQNAQRLQSPWQRELAIRSTEKNSNLPLVRFTIEHRNFVGEADSKQTSGIRKTGQGQVLLELFEDQAPATVASFISLVESGFYNGTSFYRAEPARYVAGGDPNTRNEDPADDGLGGPGYTIADESNSSQARRHFRGTISMIPNEAGRSGSRFFMSLVPIPEFDGTSTAFGRVVQGQEVLDQVTQGRTNPHMGRSGEIIPGDMLVRAEVIRKRPHPYTFIRLPP